MRFEDQCILNIRGKNSGMKDWNASQKLEYAIKFHDELNQLFKLICKLTIMCIKKSIPLIIENPYSSQHYLTRYWCIEPAVIDKDRRTNGDSFKKPTQYFFINCEPRGNILFEAIEEVEMKTVLKENQVQRSMIHPQYANRFLRMHVLEKNANDKNIF